MDHGPTADDPPARLRHRGAALAGHAGGDALQRPGDRTLRDRSARRTEGTDARLSRSPSAMSRARAPVTIDGAAVVGGVAAGIGFIVAPGDAAYAHGFGQRYDLPVPLWL